MGGFANAGLVNLLQRVVGAVDPELISGQGLPDSFVRGVEPAVAKRSLVDRVMQKHGPGLLLSVGQHLHLMQETPVATVFRRSPDPQVLAAKWLRLERYHHASHRTRLFPLGHEGWDCQRYSLASQPGAGENCLIAGVLIGLAEMVGARDCHLQIAGMDLRAADLRQADLPSGLQLDTFRIVWTLPRNRRPEGSPAEMRPDRTLADHLTDLLAADMGRSWKIADAAKLMAVSIRSLQRRLADHGSSFSTVLRRARMGEATSLLTGTATPLAEIGYCCGFADQAHFQRDFHRVTNMTPKRFREISRTNVADASNQ